MNVVEVMSCGKTTDEVIACLFERLPAYGLLPFHVLKKSVGGTGLETLVSGLNEPMGVALHITPVAEPPSFLLLGVGVIGLGILRRQQRNPKAPYWAITPSV